LAARHPAVTSELREVLRACESPLGAYLAEAELDDVPRDSTKEQVKKVEKAIFNHFKPKKAILPLRILKDAVYQLNRGLQKCIPTPKLVDRLQKDPNLLTEELPRARKPWPSGSRLNSGGLITVPAGTAPKEANLSAGRLSSLSRGFTTET
jgi:hypothetical protein